MGVHETQKYILGGGFNYFLFSPWGNDLILIFFKWIETTNQYPFLRRVEIRGGRLSIFLKNSGLPMSWLPSGGAPAKGLKVKVKVVVVVVVVVASMPKNLYVFVSLFKKKRCVCYTGPS